MMFRALCNLAITAPLMVAASAESTSDECSTDEWDEATFLQLGYSQKKDKATVSPVQDDLDEQLARRLHNDFRNRNHTHVIDCMVTNNWTNSDLELLAACLDEAEAADGIERAEDDAEAADSVNASLQQISGISSSRRRGLVAVTAAAAAAAYASQQQQREQQGPSRFPYQRCITNVDVFSALSRHCEHDLPAGHPCHCDVVDALLSDENTFWLDAQDRRARSAAHDDDDFEQYFATNTGMVVVEEYNTVCDQLACRLCRYKGEWKFFGTISGNYGTSYSVTWGSEGSTSMEETITEESSESSMTGGSATVTGSYEFAAAPVTVEASATVEHQKTEAFSRAVAKAIGSSTTTHRSHTATRDFQLPGVVWRAEMSLKNTCDEDLEIFLDEFAMTANLNVYPRCLPGFCQHFGYCCECTAPDFALATVGDEECPGPFCSPQQTTAYSFGYRGPEKQIGCGQRVEPGGVCHVPCSSMVRGLTGVLTLQCSSVTGSLAVAFDGCNLADNDDEGFFGPEPQPEFSWVLPSSWIILADSTNYDDRYLANEVKSHAGSYWYSRYTFPHWLSFDAGQTVVLMGFAASGPTGGNSRSYFKEFEFQKSVDGSTWEVVLSGTSTAVAAGEREEFEFPAAASQHWRLFMKDNIGGDAYCALRYVEFYQRA